MNDINNMRKELYTDFITWYDCCLNSNQVIPLVDIYSDLKFYIKHLDYNCTYEKFLTWFEIERLLSYK